MWGTRGSRGCDGRHRLSSNGTASKREAVVGGLPGAWGEA